MTETAYIKLFNEVQELEAAAYEAGQFAAYRYVLETQHCGLEQVHTEHPYSQSRWYLCPGTTA